MHKTWNIISLNGGDSAIFKLAEENNRINRYIEITDWITLKFSKIEVWQIPSPYSEYFMNLVELPFGKPPCLPEYFSKINPSAADLIIEVESLDNILVLTNLRSEIAQQFLPALYKHLTLNQKQFVIFYNCNLVFTHEKPNPKIEKLLTLDKPPENYIDVDLTSLMHTIRQNDNSLSLGELMREVEPIIQQKYREILYI